MQVYDSDESGAGGMDDASTVASNDAAILLDDSSANFVGHTDAVYWSAFHPSNSTIVVTASGDDTRRACGTAKPTRWCSSCAATQTQ